MELIAIVVCVILVALLALRIFGGQISNRIHDSTNTVESVTSNVLNQYGSGGSGSGGSGGGSGSSESLTWTIKMKKNYNFRISSDEFAEESNGSNITSFKINDEEFVGTSKFMSWSPMGEMGTNNSTEDQTTPTAWLNGTNTYSFVYKGTTYNGEFEFDAIASYKRVSYTDSDDNTLKIEKYDMSDNLLEVVQDGDTSTATTKITVACNASGYSLSVNREPYTGSTLNMSSINFTDGPITLAAGDFSTKGNLVTINDTQYRVLAVNGTQAKVMSMVNVGSSKFNSSSVTTSFGSYTGQKYADSTLDQAMTNYYNSLPLAIQDAIVGQNINQFEYLKSNDTYPDPGASFSAWRLEGFTTSTASGTNYYLTRRVDVNVGARKVYALDVDDVLDYLGPTSTPQDVNEMFWNSRSNVGIKYVWLRSATSNSSKYAFMVNGYSGELSYYSYYNSYEVRPAFILDLSLLG